MTRSHVKIARVVVLVAVANNYLALLMPAKQTENWDPSATYAAGAAVDGNMATYSYTNNGANSSVTAWWQVDLGYECLVYNVTVYTPNTSQ